MMLLSCCLVGEKVTARFFSLILKLVAVLCATFGSDGQQRYLPIDLSPLFKSEQHGKADFHLPPFSGRLPQLNRDPH